LHAYLTPAASPKEGHLFFKYGARYEKRWHQNPGENILYLHVYSTYSGDYDHFSVDNYERITSRVSLMVLSSDMQSENLLSCAHDFRFAGIIEIGDGTFYGTRPLRVYTFDDTDWKSLLSEVRGARKRYTSL
jgi:hypothetical protein